MRKPRSLAMVSAMVMVVVLGAVSDVAAGRASRTRSGGGSSTGGKVAGGSRSGGAPRVASGRATYGHYRGGGGHHHGYYGHYGYYGYYGAYGYYGYWPYDGYWYPGYGYWGWPVVYQVRTGYRVPAGIPARVETDVRPKKARVFVDGVEVGQARDYNGNWDVLEVPPGRRTIELRADGYMSLRLAIDARAGATYRIDERLQPGDGLDPRSDEPAAATTEAESSDRAAAPPPALDRGLQRGMLRLRVSPPDAAVYLDGEFLARADELARLHGAIPVAAGLHVVEVVRPGFEGETREIDVTGDRPVELTLALERKGS